MLGDFIPDHELEAIWTRIGATRFVLLGCGAVGSWVADGITRMGGKKFLLADPDEIEISNLNRSLYIASDVGKHKTAALGLRIRAIQPAAIVLEARDLIETTADLGRLIDDDDLPMVVISCIDYPNVDVAAALVNRFCVERDIPLVVAGGYNLHLSLIGMTVLPGVSACFECSLIYLRGSAERDRPLVKKLPRPYRNIGNIAPLAAITASIASMEAIRAATGVDRLRPAMLNRRGEFDFLGESFAWLDIPRQEGCPVCFDVKKATATDLRS